MKTIPVRHARMFQSHTTDLQKHMAHNSRQEENNNIASNGNGGGM